MAKPEPPRKLCEYCGRPFGRSLYKNYVESHADYAKRRFCCNPCAKKAIRKDYADTYKVCLHCKAQLTPRDNPRETPASFKRRRFCDKSCRDLFMEEHEQPMTVLRKLARRKGKNKRKAKPKCSSKAWGKGKKKRRCKKSVGYPCGRCKDHCALQCHDTCGMENFIWGMTVWSDDRRQKLEKAATKKAGLVRHLMSTKRDAND